MSNNTALTLDKVMVRDVITVGPEDTLQEVAKLMTESHVSGFPVVGAKGEVVGIISEGDLLRRYRALEMPVFVDILGGLFPLGSLAGVERQLAEIISTKVADVMTRSVATAAPEWTVGQAATVMTRHGINRLPVVSRSGRLAGIVTRADIIRAMEKITE